MGLLKGIATAVLEKTKDEVKEYLQKILDEEKKKESEEVEEKEEEKVETPQAEEIEPEEEETEEIEDPEEPEEDPLEDILPVIDEDIERLNYKSKPDRIMISYELADLAQQLPLEEFSLYIKMVIFSQDQKKNYGYLGNSLKKKLGLDEMDIEEFNSVANRLQAYGLLEIETVSDNQRTYILYLPFDEELMKRTNAAKAKKKAQESRQHKKTDNRNRKQGNRNRNNEKHSPEKQEKKTEPRKEDDLPGRMDLDMKDEDLYKSYRTFVNLEIDKAKMRVGRSNFDKIYMEAVKYIDKKYGFKVLSDSDKFKEYLTNYYISAFDIKTFDQWKKTKV
jgi:hypothetical protein